MEEWKDHESISTLSPTIQFLDVHMGNNGNQIETQNGRFFLDKVLEYQDGYEHRELVGNVIQHCTVMFCTLKDHKEMLAGYSDQAFQELHGLISEFDDAVVRAGMVKYQHVAEWYIVACPRAAWPFNHEEQANEYPSAHTVRMVELAVELQRISARHTMRDGTPVVLKVGLSAGPVAGAFVGAHRPCYCLYGTPVNTAARMAKHSDGPVRVCGAVAADIARAAGWGVGCVSAGMAEIKGLGSMEVFDIIPVLSPPAARRFCGQQRLGPAYAEGPAAGCYSVHDPGTRAGSRTFRSCAGWPFAPADALRRLLLAALASALAAALAAWLVRFMPAACTGPLLLLTASLLAACAVATIGRRRLPQAASPAAEPAASPAGGAGAPQCERKRAVVVQLDLCGFTALGRRLPGPLALAALVHRLFAGFDAAVSAAGLTRVDTVGDAYIAAGWLPPRRRRRSSARDATGDAAAVADGDSRGGCGPWREGWNEVGAGAEGGEAEAEAEGGEGDEEARVCAAALRAARAMLEVVGACRRETGRAVACRIGVSVGDVSAVVLGTLQVRSKGGRYIGNAFLFRILMFYSEKCGGGLR
jgi:class 3 adenylate cyclase